MQIVIKLIQYIIDTRTYTGNVKRKTMQCNLQLARKKKREIFIIIHYALQYYIENFRAIMSTLSS